MPLRAAIFDFDGTLADSLGLALAVCNEVAPRFELRPIGTADVERCRTLSSQELLRELGVPLWQLPQLMHAVRAGMARRIGEVRLFPGIGETLGALRGAGVRCGVLTSNSEENVRAVFAAAGVPLPELLSCGVSLFGKGTRLRRLLRSAEIPAVEACLVGDEQRDVAAAHEAGARAVAVRWGYGDPAALVAARADFVAESPAALFAWLKSVG
ncbi:MAG TPA: HAD hydrolase-like protein [Opitutaceae bacterium]|nr:HAD hydrolase-like protein [Opitutaceae bacterium]